MLDGVVDGDAVMAPAHGIAAFFDGANDVVENGVEAALGGDDGELAAPVDARAGDGVKLALVFVNGEFVELDVTGFADEGVWVRGEAIDGSAAGESEDVSGEVFVALDDLFAEVLDPEIEFARPIFAIPEILAGG